MEDYRLEQTGQEVQDILNGAAMDANLQAEVERATDAEGTLQENIDAEEQARQDADGLLQQGIDDEAQRAKDAEEANAGEIEGIKALIPSTASDANKLADTDYVNSSIQTATAEYRGDYNVVTDLHLAIDATHAQIETLLPTVIAEADKNDYCYVMIPTNAQTPTEIAKIERYKMTSEGWKFEYDVNNSTFTAEEWAAIKSGITSGLVGKLNALPTNADLLLLLAGKQDVLTFDSVPVPESNNPVKSGGVYSAIDDEKTARLNSDTAIHTELDGLQAKVPATASSDNKLVDQNQMNSSISTATATYRGDWNVVSDLHLAVDATRAQIAALLPTVISTADNNDYCYVEIPTSAETPAQIERVERYKFNGTAWAFEYVLNNSGFTAAQWAAINSMITSGLVAKLSALPTNADLLAMLAQKQDVLTFDSTPTENSTNPVISGGVFAADKALSDAIEAILLLIPSAASSLNKLVDTSLMNSSISTATATFRGTYNLVSNLGLGIDATEGQIAAALSTAISTADNNDYAFVQIPTSAETPAQIARTDRYKFNGTAWAFEYTLNTSGFTAAQWAAINSTITSALVSKLNALPTAAELQEAIGVLTSGITAINQKIPSTASQSNKLVDNASMESYIAQVINILDASFNVTSTDGHITLHITQVDGVITSVQVQSTDIASAADLALKASQADLTALASRVTTAEGNITSLTGRMGTAETNIANLQQLYNNLQQSKPVPVTALPSTGQQQGVIYRLAGTTSYSDYMWDGSSWVLMATYNNAIDPRPKKASQNLVTSGGVFDNIGALDVSELNATENPHRLAQYADLSAALAAIPTDYQKGGMSIKFVQSSDNKYVQYRLTTDTFNATYSNWKNVDYEPIAYQNTADISELTLISPDSIVAGYYFQANGSLKANASFSIYKYAIIPGKLYTFSGIHSSSVSVEFLGWADAGDNLIIHEPFGGVSVRYVDKAVMAPSGMAYAWFNVQHSTYPWAYNFKSVDDSLKSRDIANKVAVFDFSDEILFTADLYKNVDNNGNIRDLAAAAIYKFPVNGNHLYAFNAKYGDYFNCYVINWFSSNGTFISHEIYTAEDGYEYTNKIIQAPYNASYLYINVHYTAYPDAISVKEATPNGEYLYSADLKQLISNNSSAINNHISESNQRLETLEISNSKFTAALSNNVILCIPYEVAEGYVLRATSTTAVLNELESCTVLKYRIESDIFVFNAIYTSAFSGVYVINWIDANNKVISREYFGTSGQVDLWKDICVIAPDGAVEMWMNAQKSQADLTNFKEVSADELIQSRDLQSQIDFLKQNIGNLKVVINSIGEMTAGSVPFYIRTAYNSEKDIIITHRINNNSLITFQYTYIGEKSLTDEQLMTSPYLVSTHEDSTSPLRYYTQYWHLFAQHGYPVPYFANSVGMTSADVGAEWKDQLERRYKIGKVTDSYIWLLPVIYQDANGHYTRDWYSTHTGTSAITSLTHVSGGSYTQQITVPSIEQQQLQPIMEVSDRVYLINGNIVTEPGTYYADELKVSETEIGYDPATINDWFGNDGKPNLSGAQKHVVFTYNYNYKGAQCSVNTTIHCLREAKGYYGGTQQQFFFDNGDYKAMFMIPKAKEQNGVELDKPFNSPSSSAPAYSINRSSSHLKDINDPVDRQIGMLHNPINNTYLVGMAAGLSLVKGDTVKNKRNQICLENSLLLSFSPANTNKFYVSGINTSAFESGYYPAGYFKEVDYYVSYFDPAENVGQVYWYKDGSKYVIYCHCQSIQNVLSINVPSFMDGLKLSIVEKTINTELLSDTIANGKFFVNYNTADANYIVLIAE